MSVCRAVPHRAVELKPSSQKFVLLALWVVLMALINAAAFHEADAQPESLHFRHFSTREGLSSSVVYDVLQDSLGFIWIGTEFGLNRYDGHTVVRYGVEEADASGLSSPFVMRMALDRRGVVWLGNREGVFAFDPSTEKATEYPFEGLGESVANVTVLDLLASVKTGHIWVSMAQNGLWRIDPGTGLSRHWTSGGEESPGSPGSPENPVLSLAEDAAGDLWAGTEQGELLRIDVGDETVARSLRLPQAAGAISALAVDAAGTVWAGTEAGVFRLDPGQDAAKPVAPALLDELDVTTIVPTDEGRLWIGTFNSGLVSYAPETGNIARFANDPADAASLVHDNIERVYVDRTGSLWVATWGGLAIADLYRKPFQHLRAAHGDRVGLSHPMVLSLAEDRDGTLWVGTLDGLDRIDRATGVSSSIHAGDPEAGGLVNDEVWSLLIDREGQVWVGTYGFGLSRYDRGRRQFQRIEHVENLAEGVAPTPVFYSYETRDGVHWFGTYVGLIVEDPRTGAFRKVDGGLPAESSTGVRAIEEDRQGRLWVGTEGGGILVLDRESERFTVFDQAMGPEWLTHVRNVYALHEDRDGDLWAATSGGLYVSRPSPDAPESTHRRLLTAWHGLPATQIVGILEDSAGRIWVSTSEGLARIEKSFREPEGFHASITAYGREDGIDIGQFFIGPTLAARDGTFFFGGDNGLVYFDPEAIHENPHPPRVVLTDFKLANTSVPVRPADAGAEAGAVLPRHIAYVDTLNLRYTDRVLTFDFAAIHFASPESNRYLYRLDGFDREWQHTTHASVTYTNLDPGQYVLRLKAESPDGVQQPDETRLTLIVSPPFWETSWFQLLSILMAIGSIVLVYRVRMRAIRMRNSWLEREVNDRTEVVRRQAAALEDSNTELKAINEALNDSNRHLEERTTELRLALEQNQEILGITAHDLKNPLGGMIGLAELIREDLSAIGATGEVAENADMIKREAEQMLENIKNLLEKCRADSPTAGGIPSTVGLVALVETVLRRNQKQAADKAMPVRFSHDGEVAVRVDAAAMQRVVDNLMSNAVKYNLPGKTIDVRVERTEDIARFSIRDQGPGLNEADKRDVFGKLKRLSARPTGLEDSIGLGLFIVKQVVEEHNGRVGVESVAGAGATFWFELPLHVAAEERASS